MDDDRMTSKDLILLFSILGMTLSILMLVGICGGLDQDKITFAEAMKKSAIWMVVFIASVVGIIKGEKEEE
ncbi:MAG: hypothetical protein J5647_08830 [Spirochaetaceae bacterium]|nr:hypothetical protein [Spirochaetaceae bacterium]